ncbi:acyltransferase PGAP2-like [Tubulanus polymorphus]|uniref:acyltransferase PGAP2-like n=1 Tax=Tubulanus polymorphus TaxID=672921 RepID=UPI003DA6892B
MKSEVEEQFLDNITENTTYHSAVVKMGSDNKKSDTSVVILKHKWMNVVIYSCGLPLLAMLLCVILSIVFDYDASTRTHCGVSNYLPSISAAIGGFTPQRYIWRLFVGAHYAPRCVIPFIYVNYFKNFPNRHRPLYMATVYAMFILNQIEVACLMVLTCVSSTENFDVHENSFIVFMVCSEIYMLLQLITFRWARDWKPLNDPIVKKSYRHKCFFFLANISIFLLAVYFFFRHNSYCEPGVYTLFALCEYFVVLTNILYHSTLRFDIPNAVVTYAYPKSNLR